MFKKLIIKTTSVITVVCMLTCSGSLIGFAKSGGTKITNLNSKSGVYSPAGAPQKNYLLYGYNTLTSSGNINPKDIGKRNIIDAGKLNATDCSETSMRTTDINYCHSTEISDFYKQFTAKAKIAYDGVAFSGSASSEFSIDKKISQNKEYLKYTKTYLREELSNGSSTKKLSSMLSQNFLDDLETYKNEPEKIFQYYGTHLITDCYLGGNATLNFTYSNKETHTETELQASVEAAYNCASASASADDKKTADLVCKNSNLAFQSSGGDFMISGDSVEVIASQFTSWLNTIDNSPMLCGFSGGSLIPIWELFPEKSDNYNLLKETYEKLSNQQKIELDNMEVGPITDIIVVSTAGSEDEARKMVPRNYNIVPVNPDVYVEDMNCNRKAGGNEIFIAYTYDTVYDRNHNKLNPIVDIAVKKGRNASVENFTRLNVDLNGGIKGSDFVFLFIRRATDEEYNNDKTVYLSKMGGYYTKDFTLPAGWFSPNINEDLNEDAGGKYIYVTYKTCLRNIDAKASHEEGSLAASETITDSENSKLSGSNNTGTGKKSEKIPGTGDVILPTGVLGFLSASAAIAGRKKKRK